jgi:hypothetical protein
MAAPLDDNSYFVFYNSILPKINKFVGKITKIQMKTFSEIGKEREGL